MCMKEKMQNAQSNEIKIDISNPEGKLEFIKA